MIVLDTNVISALIQAAPDPTVLAWANAQRPDLVWTTAITVFEIQFGLAAMTTGQRRQALQEAADRVLDQMGKRVLDFDRPSAGHAAAIGARLRSMGRPIDMRDTFIAGTVAAHNATLATRDVKLFVDSDIQLIDPWQFKPAMP